MVIWESELKQIVIKGKVVLNETINVKEHRIISLEDEVENKETETNELCKKLGTKIDQNAFECN